MAGPPIVVRNAFAINDDGRIVGVGTVASGQLHAVRLDPVDASLSPPWLDPIAGDKLLDDSLRLRLVTELSIAAGRMVSGQQLDLEAEGKELDLESIKRIHSGKTGALIGFSVRAGGLIASADVSELDILTEFGNKLGLLFQITDDILDVTSTSDALGKTPGKDLADKKATYPEVLGLEKAQLFAKQAEVETSEVLAPLNRDIELLIEICKYVSNRPS